NRLLTIMSEGNSNYNSLQVNITRNMSHQSTTMLSYTLSKCIDDASGSYVYEEGAWGLSNPYDARTDRGLCTFDSRNGFRGSTIVALPLHGNKWVEGWQVSGMIMTNSGRPFSVTDGFDQAGFQNRQNSRPDAVAGCGTKVGRVDRWYDPDCF